LEFAQGSLSSRKKKWLKTVSRRPWGGKAAEGNSLGYTDMSISGGGKKIMGRAHKDDRREKLTVYLKMLGRG